MDIAVLKRRGILVLAVYSAALTVHVFIGVVYRPRRTTLIRPVADSFVGLVAKQDYATLYTVHARQYGVDSATFMRQAQVLDTALGGLRAWSFVSARPLGRNVFGNCDSYTATYQAVAAGGDAYQVFVGLHEHPDNDAEVAVRDADILRQKNGQGVRTRGGFSVRLASDSTYVLQYPR
jgi:hypothetical protein